MIEHNNRSVSFSPTPPPSSSTIKQQQDVQRISNNSGPMWSDGGVGKMSTEEESSLDGFYRSPDKSDKIVQPPPSPFSEFFPMGLLSESGVDLVDLGQEKQTNIRRPMPRTIKIKQPNGAKTHFCTQCNAGFTRGASLKKHVLEKHTLAPLRRCSIGGCSFVTRNAYSQLLHKRSHLQRGLSAGKPQYFCKLCRCRYTQRRSLLQHITNIHGSDASLIGMSQVSENGVVCLVKSIDSGTHESASNIINEPPKKITRSSTRASRSSSTASSDQSISIGSCRDQNPSPSNLSPSSSQKSIKKPPEKKLYLCDRCSFSTTTFRTLFTHKQKLHASKDISSLKGGRLKTRRKKTPPNDQLFVCDYCDFQTTTRRVATAHRKMHQLEDGKSMGKFGSKSEAPTASVAPYIANKTPNIETNSLDLTNEPELESVISNLNQANACLVRLLGRKDEQIALFRANVLKLVHILLPTNHQLQPALERNLIRGRQVDQMVLNLLGNQLE